MTSRDPVHLDQPRPNTGPDALLDDDAELCEECDGTGYIDSGRDWPAELVCEECEGTGYNSRARMTASDHEADRADSDNDAAALGEL